MSDLLLELSEEPAARGSLMQSLGLPIPLPQPLARDAGPWRERPLADARVGRRRDAGRGARRGARRVRSPRPAPTPSSSMPAALAALFRDPGETFGRPARRSRRARRAASRSTPLVFDATGLREVADLRALLRLLPPARRRASRGAAVSSCSGARRGRRYAARRGSAGGARGLRPQRRQGDRPRPGRRRTSSSSRAARRVASGPCCGSCCRARSAFVTGQPIVVTARARAVSEPAARAPAREEGRPRHRRRARHRRGDGPRLSPREGAHVVCLDRPEDDGPASQLARTIGGTVAARRRDDPEAPADDRGPCGRAARRRRRRRPQRGRSRATRRWRA